MNVIKYGIYEIAFIKYEYVSVCVRTRTRVGAFSCFSMPSMILDLDFEVFVGFFSTKMRVNYVSACFKDSRIHGASDKAKILKIIKLLPLSL